jgi:hypothetical protein
MSDIEKKRIEVLRWRILQTLNVGRPYMVSEDLLMSTVCGDDMPVSPQGLRRELDYLEDRKLVKLTGRDTACWSAELTHYGVDVVEYTIECLPGIVRPPKYWGG